MKLSSTVFWAASLLTAKTLASDASIYVSGFPPGAFRQTVSPSTTRLLLAQRLGLSRFHSLKGADETTLSILNDFGGEQKTLLSANRWSIEGQRRHLIVIEGVQNAEDIIPPRTHKVAFKLPDPPHFSHTSQLVKDFFRQAQDTSLDGQLPCSHAIENVVGISGGTIASLKLPGDCVHGSPNTKDWTSVLSDSLLVNPHRSAILHISLPDSPNSKEAAAIDHLRQTLSYLLDLETDFTTTVILMPPFTQKTKRSPTSPYGSYLMPNPKALQAREAQSEEQLLQAPPAPTTSSAASHNHQSTPQTLKASSVPSSKSPGILPFCQPSLEKLLDATHNCSGHGVPYLKHNSTEVSCYVCQCQKTIIHRDGGGVKTIEWSGPGCSKKDVSVPFWLLAGITIAMVATVSWGIGLLFSIGQEELPSVIGAGVAGPRAQK
ncbi:MAG: hypothetical protein Q9185_003739 [Variospora sp. 1 TL-2023]